MITIKRYGGFKDGRLQRFANKVKKGKKITLKNIADNVRDNAKNIVAVKTGRLQRSLRVLNLTNNSAMVSTSVPYAGFVEYGTIHMNAQPYLRPAIAKTSKIVGRTVSIQINNAWRGS